MTVRDYLVSVIRTVVPTAAGLIVAYLAKLGLGVDEAIVSGLLDVVCVGAYHAGVRALEARWPAFGVFLGWKASAVYPQ